MEKKYLCNAVSEQSEQHLCLDCCLILVAFGLFMSGQGFIIKEKTETCCQPSRPRLYLCHVSYVWQLTVDMCVVYLRLRLRDYEKILRVDIWLMLWQRKEKKYELQFFFFLLSRSPRGLFFLYLNQQFFHFETLATHPIPPLPNPLHPPTPSIPPLPRAPGLCPLVVELIPELLPHFSCCSFML